MMGLSTSSINTIKEALFSIRFKHRKDKINELNELPPLILLLVSICKETHFAQATIFRGSHLSFKHFEGLKITTLDGGIVIKTPISLIIGMERTWRNGL